MVVQQLVDEGFRAVRVVAGDSVSVTLSSEGQLRVWGSFRVRPPPPSSIYINSTLSNHTPGFRWLTRL